MSQFRRNIFAITGGPIKYFETYTTTTLYVERTFGGECRTITVSNDSDTDTVTISYDGATIDGVLKAGETVTLNVMGKASVYIKGDSGGGEVRLWCW